MEKLLSDIDVSRSVPAAMFLELEAAARSGMFSLSLYIRFEAVPLYSSERKIRPSCYSIKF